MPAARRSMRPWLGLAALIALCFAVAGLGGLVTAANTAVWYSQLARPSWTPPDWVFGPVWSLLYLGMAVAAWLVWQQGGLLAAAGPLTLFAVQLALNAAWSWLFFGLHSPAMAFVEIVLLWAAIAATMTAFWCRSLAAGVLFVPYFGWVSFATVLNFAIWRLNS